MSRVNKTHYAVMRNLYIENDLMPEVDYFTTLNASMNIGLVIKGTMSKNYLKYLGIGIGKVENIETITSQGFKPHALNRALYNHIPFIVRLLATDLIQSEREKYRIRVVKNINGIDYVLYYLRIFNNTEITINEYKVSRTDDGIDTPNVFVPQNENLNVLKYTPESYMLSVTNFIVAVKKYTIVLTTEELNEIYLGLQILYPNETKTIGEFGLFSGVDGNDTSNNVELADTQLNYIVKTNGIPILQVNENNVIREIDIGGMEVMI